MSGWICLHRKLLDWEWYDDIPATRLFIHCILKANHKEKKWKGIVIKRGSFITGRTVLANETGLTEQQIRTAITKLKSTSDITIKSTNKFSIVTVVNYGSYQDKEEQSTSKALHQHQTNNKRTTTTNNDNNDNKKDMSVINDAFEHWWAIFPAARRKNKKGCLDKFKAKCSKLTEEQVVSLTNEISTDVTRRIAEVEDIKYLPTTEPYLNQERWNDQK